MAVLATIVGLLFLVTFLGWPWAGGGWFWDPGNALGFVAFAGLLFQMIPYARAGTGRRHESLGYWVLGVAFAHAFWFLAGDGAVWTYLRPGAPLAMWLGLAGLVALAALTVLARMPDRMRVHKRFHAFRTVHRGLGFAAVAAAGLHILLTGFYLSSWVQDALFLALVLAACLGRSRWARLGAAPRAAAPAYLAAGAVAAAVFVLARNLVW